MALKGCILALCAAAAVAQSSPSGTCCPPARTVSISGEGQVKKTPDQAILSFAVVTNGTSPEKAQDGNSNATAAAVQFVVGLGIDRMFIRLDGLSLQPKQVWQPETTLKPGQYVDAGYEASRSISVEVQDTTGDFKVLGPLVAGIVADGRANRVQSVQYGLVDPGVAKAEALSLATKDALRRAESMALGLGAEYTLGPVLTVNEGSVYIPGPYPMVMAKYAAMDSAEGSGPSTPDTLPAGDITIQANVNMQVELV